VQVLILTNMTPKTREDLSIVVAGLEADLEASN